MPGQKQIAQLYLHVKENELSTDGGLNFLTVQLKMLGHMLPKKAGCRTNSGFLNHELRVTSYESRVAGYDIKITSYELKSTSYNIKSTSYELESTSYNIKSTSYNIRITSYELPHYNHELRHILA